jgi:hypothetical protein
MASIVIHNVTRSAVQKTARSAIKNAARSAAKKTAGLGSVNNLRDMLSAASNEPDAVQSRRNGGKKSAEERPAKLSPREEAQEEYQHQLYYRLKQERLEYKRELQGFDATKRMIKEIAGNNPALAGLLADQKSGRRIGGKKPKTYPPANSAYSTNVDGISYDAQKKQMFITFRNGSVYQYFEVPEVVYNDLLTTINMQDSIGERFWDLVRKRGKGNKYWTRYSYRRIK